MLEENGKSEKTPGPQTLPPLDRWQYRLIPLEWPVDPVETETVLGDWRLQVGADLPLWPITDCDGVPAGFLLGYPIALRDVATAVWISGAHKSSAKLGGDRNAFVDAVFNELAGRFLWVCDCGAGVRVYTDCAGQIPCVFDTERGIVGSTAHALMTDSDYQSRFDQVLYDRLGVEGLGWLPGGLTAHRGLSRLLPNHMLDPNRMAVSRQWPPGPIAETADTSAAVSKMAALIEAQIAAIIEGAGRTVAQALTAGRETRMLLGCARPLKDKIDLVTVAGDDQYKVDTVMAQRIAEEEGLRHRKLPRVQASDEARKLYLRRGGHCIADANANYFPSVHPIAESHVFVGGAGGEIGRGFFWRSGDHGDLRLSGENLVNRFGLSPEPRLIAEMEKWVEGLSGFDALSVLDLAYVEQRMGPWSGAQFCNDPTLVRMAPLLNRQLVEIMLSLPSSWKRSEKMTDAILETTWPELERYPYNSLGVFKDVIMRVQRVLSDPGIVVRKLRKKLF
ncbi:MAG: hypothetical protein AB3N11_07710 [Arenibacterium sp.]